MAYGYIYLIENDVNDKLYIGQTINPDVRRRAHFAWASSCGSMPIKHAMDKHGRENFDFVLLEACSSLEELNDREVYWIEALNTISPNGYNLTRGGDSDIPGDETRRRMSAWQKGKRQLSEKQKKQISVRHKGKILSAETRNKISKNSPHRKKTHCINGHLLTGKNTYICTRTDGRIYRRCYTCMKESNRRTYYRKKLRNTREG